MLQHPSSGDDTWGMLKPRQIEVNDDCQSHLGRSGERICGGGSLGRLRVADRRLSLHPWETLLDAGTPGGAAPPRARAVPPVRNTSAAAMQSPPASADATSVIILSPVFARPVRAAKVEMVVDQLGQAQAPGQGGRKDQPGIGHQAVVVEGDADAVGVVAWQHLLGAPCFWLVFEKENHYPRCTGALSCLFRTPLHALLRWIRAKPLYPLSALSPSLSGGFGKAAPICAPRPKGIFYENMGHMVSNAGISACRPRSGRLMLTARS